ncbi:MAG: response regulator [Verrucomicrobia bacterium]|nr:response regulator [Verrucomicrobiota bacterium]
MRTRYSYSSLNLAEVSRSQRPSRASGDGLAQPATQKAILLVSDDTTVGENLRHAAEGAGRLVIQAVSSIEALRTVRSAQLAAVLLDLDLPSQRAWEIADHLLQEPGCPPLILLTGQRDQFDVNTAIRAGSLADKSASLTTLLEVVDQALSLPDSNRVERNAIQRIMIQWLRPCGWSVPVTPVRRFWSRNE